jgi:hypothetical protein
MTTTQTAARTDAICMVSAFIDALSYLRLTDEDSTATAYLVGVLDKGALDTLADALVATGYRLTRADEIWSTNQVAAHLGIEPGSVRKKLRRAGVHPVALRGWPGAQVKKLWPVELVKPTPTP